MATQYACSPVITADQLLDAKCACSLDEEVDAELITDVINDTSDILSILTGGVVSGICEVTVRPIALAACGGGGWMYEAWAPRDWTDQYGGVNTIPLRGPNVDIREILIDGAVLSPTEYGLLDDVNLFRRNAAWPTTNDVTKLSTEVGTFEIRYRFGRPWSRLARLAGIELACELAKEEKGTANVIGRGITGANVQGASITLRNRAEALRDGDEQLPALARFLALWAPDGPAQRPSVWAPELEQAWNLIEVEGPSGS